MIGKLVKSNSHTDYICQIYGTGEVESPPKADAYAFGSFVRIPLGEDAGALIGIVYDTMLLNPEFGTLGPRLSPEPDLAVFSPDYLAEKVTLVGIKAVGMVDGAGSVTQGVPPLAAHIDAPIVALDDAGVRAFHQMPDGRVQIGYAPVLLGQAHPLARHLLMCVLDRLRMLFPEAAAHLDVVRHELTWQAYLGPLGGNARGAR